MRPVPPTIKMITMPVVTHAALAMSPTMPPTVMGAALGRATCSGARASQ